MKFFNRLFLFFQELLLLAKSVSTSKRKNWANTVGTLGVKNFPALEIKTNNATIGKITEAAKIEYVVYYLQ